MSFLGNEYLFTALITIIVFTVIYKTINPIFDWLSSKTFSNKEHILKRLELLFVETNEKKVTQFLIICSFAPASLIFLIFWPNILWGIGFSILGLIGGWKIPKILIDFMYERRCHMVADQMVDAMTLMANGIRSGLSVNQSMERVAQNMPSPISQEFNLVISQTKLGLSLEEALNNLGNRIPRPDIQMFVISVNILKETGGNMSETFQTIMETIRERTKVQKKIQALTAQGVMQGIIVSSVPFVLFIMFSIMDPSFIKPLLNTTIGWGILSIIIILQVIGAIIIRKMIKIEV